MFSVERAGERRIALSGGEHFNLVREAQQGLLARLDKTSKRASDRAAYAQRDRIH